MMKTVHKQESKETASAITITNATQNTKGISKAQKENIPRKVVPVKVHKGVTTRHGQQAELQEQNQNLVAANEELEKNLLETQQRVSELELEFNDIQKEKAELQKNLKDCHILLVSAKIDPVSGEMVGNVAQQNEDQRKEVMSVSADLLKELNAFGDIASQQRAHLEKIQETIADLGRAREHIVQEQRDFSLQISMMERALEEAEALLL
ncbi:small kinetochore-associated protein isoform 2-T3 [Pholidichthys leucotaenia]